MLLSLFQSIHLSTRHFMESCNFLAQSRLVPPLQWLVFAHVAYLRVPNQQPLGFCTITTWFSNLWNKTVFFTIKKRCVNEFVDVGRLVAWAPLPKWKRTRTTRQLLGSSLFLVVIVVREGPFRGPPWISFPLNCLVRYVSIWVFLDRHIHKQRCLPFATPVLDSFAEFSVAKRIEAGTAKRSLTYSSMKKNRIRPLTVTLSRTCSHFLWSWKVSFLSLWVAPFCLWPIFAAVTDYHFTATEFI